MPYACIPNTNSWRAVAGPHQVTTGEAYSEVEPTLLEPTPEEIKATYITAITALLEDFAKSRGYSSLLSCTSYANSTVEKFRNEANLAIRLRDETWTKCYDILAAVESGSREIPLLPALLSELPVLTWSSLDTPK